jgi:predicted small metal-binding protein
MAPSVLEAYEVTSVNFDCGFSAAGNVLFKVANEVVFDHVNEAAS